MTADADQSGPLRIVIVGWACLSLQEREGTGYNLHVSELAAELAARGHEVRYIRSGFDYSLRPDIRVQPREVWRGVHCYDLVNSPNLSMAMFNFRNVETQTRCSEQTGVVLEWIRSCSPDVVHIHSLEGLSFDLVAAIRDAGLPVVFTPHNYYMLCPQVDLLHHEADVCDDYDGGLRCVGCITAPDPQTEVRRRQWTQSTEGILRNGTVRGLRRTLDTLVGARGPVMREAPPPPEPRPLPPARQPVPTETNERLLTSTRHLAVLNNYGERRRAGVAAMNQASVVLCPSQFLLNLHAAMGVDRSLMRHTPLGQPHFDAIAAAAENSAFFDSPPWEPSRATRPLRLGFFGSTRYNKGLDVLTRAILLIPDDIRRRCHFHIRAGGDVSPHRAALAAVVQASFHGAYTPADLPATLGEFDVGIVPTTGLENSPFVLLEHLHAGKFVIASNLGGVTDFVREGLNGLLIPAADPHALAAAVGRLVRGEARIPAPRQVREATPRLTTFGAYVDAVGGVYQEVLSPGS